MASTIRAALLAATLGGLAATPAFAGPGDGLTSVTGPTVFYGEAFSLGWEFATTGETISALGYNDYGFGTPHAVGVYDSSGNLLASASVTAASTLEDGYRYTAITPLVLAPGNYYLMGTTYSAGDTDGWTYQAAAFTTNAATTYIDSFFNSDATATTLMFPDSEASTRQYLEVNFQTGTTVPEPATWAMMLVGVGAVGAMSRRRREARTASA